MSTDTIRGWRWVGAVLAAALVPIVAAADAADDEADRVAAVTRPTTEFSRAEAFELRPGGAATSFKAHDHNAFSQPSQNMSLQRRLDFAIGNGLFTKTWVTAPASTTTSDGLGPYYNARSCQRCHLKDGRGHPPSGNYPADDAVSMLLRLSVPPRNAAEREALASHRQAVIPEPVYGGQLQDLALPGHTAEGRMRIDYEEVPLTLGDGTVVSLRQPIYSVTDLGYGPLDPDVMVSARVAPPMIGLGLLEAIDGRHILAQADPGDRDDDGISGRPNQVWSADDGAVRLGRFGWKAGQASIRDQSAGAFSGDIGISTPLFPKPAGDCTTAQGACLTAPHGDDPKFGGVEAGEDVLDHVTFYASNLAVPARRTIDNALVLRGKALFYDSGCPACHVPKFVTRRDETRPEQSFQLIWPYTDLLLHDMGEGLADHRPEGVADGREWRTAPLWGIGLTETVSGHEFFLHDGRARGILEAILWHGGEASAARNRVAAMSTEDRDALLAFLNSL